jgi:hypothetical protein
MVDNNSICLYHNGNRRIIEYYKKKLSNLTFCGNWSEEQHPSSHGKLWEICYADVTRENLLRANKLGVEVLRHISTFDDDQKNLIQECLPMPYSNWLNHVVSNNLIFCDNIISELELDAPTNNKTIIITTGRTANSHFQCVLESFGQSAFECSKVIDSDLLESQSAVLMWREDHWSAMASIWLATKTNQWTHNINNIDTGTINQTVPEISQEWIKTNWPNMCQAVLDSACFFKFLLKRPISLMTTERSIAEFTSPHSKLTYNKSKLIENYNQTKQAYQNSDTCELIDTMYNRITPMIHTWKVQG